MERVNAGAAPAAAGLCGRRPAPLHPTPPAHLAGPEPGSPGAVAALRQEAAEVGLPAGARRAGPGGLDGEPKKIQRRWREEGLRVPPRRHKRQRLGDSATPCERLRATE